MKLVKMHISLILILFCMPLLTSAKSIESPLKENSSRASSSAMSISSSSAPAQTRASDSVAKVQSSKGVASILMWPVKRIVQPLTETLLWPLYPPLSYVDEAEVIDRAMDLATWGPSNRITTIPIVFPLGQNDSYIGVRNIMNELLFPKFRNSQYLKYYVSGDYSFMMDFAYLWENFYYKNQLQYNHFLKKVTFPHQIEGVDLSLFPKHSDYSYYIQNQLFYNIYNNWSLNFGFDYNLIRFATKQAIFQDEDSLTKFSLKQRGFYDNFEELPLTFGVGYDSRESQFTPTYGSKFNLSGTYAFEKGFGNYASVQGQFQNYHLLGASNYKISKDEDKKRIRNLMKFKMNEAIPFLNMDDLKNGLLNRRVLVSTLRFRQAWDTQDQPMVIQGLSALGQNTPLRAYPYNRFMSYGYMAAGNEYRWPVIRRVDGVLFNEYGLFYQNPLRTKDWELRNSWGIGLRVSNSDFYFTRFQLAFHGLSGLSVLLTTSPEID